jgi:hypothetical protein
MAGIARWDDIRHRRQHSGLCRMGCKNVLDMLKQQRQPIGRLLIVSDQPIAREQGLKRVASRYHETLSKS